MLRSRRKTLFGAERPRVLATVKRSSWPRACNRTPAMSETLRMLYVDDEPLMCRAVARALALKQIDVLTASSGKEGVAVAARETVDLVMTDYMLDDITGIEVATRVRALQPGAAIVLVSGFFDWKQREAEMQAAGIEYFLSKPWDMDQLETIIREVFKRKHRP
jgi:response regulator RpfG family c-di-GMP phosphodiesterase